MKKILSLLLAAAMLVSLAACGGNTNTANNTGNESNSVVPEDVKAMSYADYMAAGEDSIVVIEGYVQFFAYNGSYGNVSMYIQSDEGSYYAFRAACSPEQASMLSEGSHVKVSGKKTFWAGGPEVAEGCSFEILEGNNVYPRQDITSGLADVQKLQSMINTKISVKGLTVLPSTDAEGRTAAFLYKWDGSGAPGTNDDIYFTAGRGDAVYTYTVETDEWPAGSEPYKAAETLGLGDTIDLEGMLYWYNGPNIHVSSIKVTRANRADTVKSDGVLTNLEFINAEPEAECDIEGYVQASFFDKESETVSMYLVDADGYYYASAIESSDVAASKLIPGTKVKVSGIKASESGMPFLTGGSFEILSGYYVPPIKEDISGKLGDSETLRSLIAARVDITGLTVAASTTEEEDGDHAFLYNLDGSGQEGMNCDLYFKAKVNGKTHTFKLDAGEFPEGSELYKAVTGLNIGDVLDLEAFVFWNDGPELRVQSLSVKPQ